MYTKKRFSRGQILKWTRLEILFFLLLAAGVTVLHAVFKMDWVQVPWIPLALVGTAVAFILGFQNNAAYGRIWEARKIWGGIVNTSRTWGMKIMDMVGNDHAVEPASERELRTQIKTLTYRHIAWLTALRHSMRQEKSWEVVKKHKTNKEWQQKVSPPEYDATLEEDLKPYLSASELEYVLSKGNKQTALLYLQSHHIKELKNSGYIWEFAFLELENVLEELFTLQGKSERIKNFPYPRQYASLGFSFVNLFVLLLPFGVVPQFAKLGQELSEHSAFIADYFIWFAIPFSALISWIFSTMLRIGTTGENPFEGTVNDVPISTISRAIEINLREMLDENPTEIPTQFPEKLNVQF